MRHIGRSARIAAAGIVGIVLGCIAIEIALRVTDLTDYNVLMNDPQSGLLMYRPGSTYIDEGSCFQNVVKINNIGFHASDVAIVKPPHVFRIVVLGASFVDGSQIPIPSLLSSVLQSKLNDDPHRSYTYEVTPIAFAGNGTFLSTLYFMRFGAPLSPDLVIDVETGGELGRDVPTDLYPPRFDAQGKLILSLPKSAQDSRLLLVKELARSSKLLVNLRARYTLFTINLESMVSHDPISVASTTPDDTLFPSGSAALWPVEAKVTEALAAEVSQAHARLLIATWTNPTVATSTAQELVTHVSAIASQAGASYVDMVPQISADEKQRGESSVFPCNGHWSVAGDSYAADALYRYLSTHRALIGG